MVVTAREPGDLKEGGWSQHAAEMGWLYGADSLPE